MYTFGIIGQGFVGNAIYCGLKQDFNILTFDIDEEKRNTAQDLPHLLTECEVIFICVPTPMEKNGRCSIENIDLLLNVINFKIAELELENKIIVIKSTIPPKTTKLLQEKYGSNLDIVFNPEFLTEANSVNDFKNQNRIILGGDKVPVKKVKQIYQKTFPNIKYVEVDSTTAEMVKYFTNTFLAMKVTFGNEIKHICDGFDIDYDKVKETACLDNRILDTHMKVPGPDGELGFGGHCFPKDLKGLIYAANENDIDTTLLEAVWEKNELLRSNKDWISMSGRAVI